MTFRYSFLLIALLGFAAPANAADSRGERVALVIGNAKYPDAESPLKEPVNDARDVADELKRDGFDVEIGENLSGDAHAPRFAGSTAGSSRVRSRWCSTAASASSPAGRAT